MLYIKFTFWYLKYRYHNFMLCKWYNLVGKYNYEPKRLEKMKELLHKKIYHAEKRRECILELTKIVDRMLR